ncbi:hypothetical protein [Vibrio breoganii]|uniref:hypothetical protein n=1 Tax=Vibrio breoganii TaxID=553239 RepID=UPI00148256A2|nr:hypothetical protein [Vibrio breoganii]
MNLKPIQFVILGVIVGFFMNNLYHVSQEARAADKIANHSPFSNCSVDQKQS